MFSGISRISLGGGRGEECTNLLFDKSFAKICMKIKEVGPRGGSAATVSPSMDPPMVIVNILLQKVNPSFDLLICAVCKLGDF